MKLSSPAFGHDQPIPKLYSCDGEDISPPLSIVEVPAGSRSLALIMHDPDASSGDFVHWTAWNIPPDTNQLKAGSLPAGITEGKNDFGKNGYGGPCPARGKHRYIFELFALNDLLPVPPGVEREELLRAMEGHMVNKTELIGTYERK